MFRIFKRLFDIISASMLIIMISPLLLVIAVAVKYSIGSPVFFIQVRSGIGQKPFIIKKFRTMTNETDSNGDLLPDEMRQTKIGNFLRSSSLDELPELLSIIKGDMSVIGPRPLPPLYDVYYTDREKKRFNVRSGLLPPDSVAMSAIITWDKQLEYEADYAENLSLVNDLRIFWSAIKMVFIRKRIDYGRFIRKPLNEERKINDIR